VFAVETELPNPPFSNMLSKANEVMPAEASGGKLMPDSQSVNVNEPGTSSVTLDRDGSEEEVRQQEGLGFESERLESGRSLNVEVGVLGEAWNCAIKMYESAGNQEFLTKFSVVPYEQMVPRPDSFLPKGNGQIDFDERNEFGSVVRRFFYKLGGRYAKAGGSRGMTVKTRDEGYESCVSENKFGRLTPTLEDTEDECPDKLDEIEIRERAAERAARSADHLVKRNKERKLLRKSAETSAPRPTGKNTQAGPSSPANLEDNKANKPVSKSGSRKQQKLTRGPTRTGSASTNVGIAVGGSSPSSSASRGTKNEDGKSEGTVAKGRNNPKDEVSVRSSNSHQSKSSSRTRASARENVVGRSVSEMNAESQAARDVANARRQEEVRLAKLAEFRIKCQEFKKAASKEVRADLRRNCEQLYMMQRELLKEYEDAQQEFIFPVWDVDAAVASFGWNTLRTWAYKDRVQKYRQKLHSLIRPGFQRPVSAISIITRRWYEQPAGMTDAELLAYEDEELDGVASARLKRVQGEFRQLLNNSEAAVKERFMKMREGDLLCYSLSPRLTPELTLLMELDIEKKYQTLDAEWLVLLEKFDFASEEDMCNDLEEVYALVEAFRRKVNHFNDSYGALDMRSDNKKAAGLKHVNLEVDVSVGLMSPTTQNNSLWQHLTGRNTLFKDAILTENERELDVWHELDQFRASYSVCAQVVAQMVIPSWAKGDCPEMIEALRAQAQQRVITHYTTNVDRNLLYSNENTVQLIMGIQMAKLFSDRSHFHRGHLLPRRGLAVKR